MGKEGWVLKKGPQKLAGWKKRYLQLTGNKQVGYYTDDSMVKKKGTIWLASRTINHIKRSTKTSDSKHHGFCIITSGRTYQFCVSSSTDRDHWIQKIRETIDSGWDKHKVQGSISYSSSPHNGYVPYGSSAKHNTSSIQPNFGYSDNAYDDDTKISQPIKQAELEWDDDDEDEENTSSTLKIAVNILKENQSNNAYPQAADDINEESDDRFAHRSKYKKRNVLTEEEAQAQIQELEEKNDNILDNALKTSYEIQNISADTAQKLDEQRSQLIGIDKSLHEIDSKLDKTEHTLNGMKSIGGMIKNKFKKKKNSKKDVYTPPNGNESTFERTQNENISTPSYASESVSIHESDNVQNNKLDEQDEIIKSISDKMDKVNPRLQQQSNTMKK